MRQAGRQMAVALVERICMLELWGHGQVACNESLPGMAADEFRFWAFFRVDRSKLGKAWFLQRPHRVHHARIVGVAPDFEA